MQPIVLEQTKYSPRVEFDPAGVLSLKGRSLMIDALNFYRPIIAWASEITIPSLILTVELDYFNTSSTKKILELLKILDDNKKIQEFIVYWGFESDDEDILIKGQIMATRMKKAKFLFRELTGV